MKIVIVGGGPAGLMAAEAASSAGAEVDLYDAMASVGRKFLLAGKGGLNLTHSEPIDSFLSRYGARQARLASIIQSFGPNEIREWARALGIGTFVGTSGRIFPIDFKAAPLLRAWLRRLRLSGVRFHVRHRWSGWGAHGSLRFLTPAGERSVVADAVILALGGGSWPKLGSDFAWIPILNERQVPIAPLLPANCGFNVKWTDHFRTKFSGHPVKSVGVVTKTVNDVVIRRRGEFIITKSGVEGGVIYAVSASLRDVIAEKGVATLRLDLTPDREVRRLSKDLSRPRSKQTIATQLARRAGITGVKAGLLREVLSREEFADPVLLAAAIKSLPVRLASPRPLAEAISTAGGVPFEELDERLMIRRLPGVFSAGEMLDWEAPTGGYLLTACLATGHIAGVGAVAWMREGRARPVSARRTAP